MSKSGLHVSLAIVAAAVPAAGAHAAELSTTSSSGTMNITVYIPPIAPALKAQAQGAVGLWSIQGQFEGLMVKVDHAGSDAQLTLFQRPGNLMAVSTAGPDWSQGSLITPSERENSSGLIRTTYESSERSRSHAFTVIGL